VPLAVAYGYYQEVATERPACVPPESSWGRGKTREHGGEEGRQSQRQLRAWEFLAPPKESRLLALK
jgi:hypothetical protein